MLVKCFQDIMDVGFTAGMENKLDDIEEGGVDWHAVIGDFYPGFAEKLKNASSYGDETTDIVCQKCGHFMIRRMGKYGKYLACSNYPECKNIVSESKEEISSVRCPKCGENMIVKSGKFGKFLACPNYPDCKSTLSMPSDEEPKLVGKCPECGAPMTARKSKKGKIYYSCSGYPDCKFMSWDIPTGEKCPKCGCTHLHQDEDVLDTWFSSALWPFSTLGWPNEDSADLKYFYPTNTLVTGYDIIGFWVSRMIFSGLAYTGKAPFDTVCIHGIVRDSQGRKMSKSLGNGIDPLEVIAQYGADALRFMLLDGSTPGNDMRYSEKKVEAARNFANKLWNATRFVLMNLPEDFQPGLPEESKLDMSDKWVLTKLNQVAGAMTDNLDHFEMGLAAAKINSFIWDVYCDWFIEIAKPRLNSGDAEQADTARRVLVYVLDKALKLLHPFMPFITEELYQALPGSAETIMTQSWPTFDEAHNWAEEEEAFEKVMDYIKAVRTMRTEMNVHPAKKTSMIIETADPAPFRNAEVYLAKFAFATDVTFTEKYEGSTDGMVQVSTHTARGFIPMMELIDREKELARLNKEKAKAEKELAMFENQLANPKFVERAPAALVEEIRAKRTNSQSKLANIEQSIKALG